MSRRSTTSIPYLFGVSGSYRVAQVLQFTAELPEPPLAADLEPFLVRELVPAIAAAVEARGVAGFSRAFLGERVALLLGCRGQLWGITSDLTILPEPGGFGAIGSGRIRAYSALHALQAAGVEPVMRRLELALEAAAAFTSTVRPPWTFLSSKGLAESSLADLAGCTGYHGPRRSLEEMDAAISEGVLKSR